MELKSGYKRTEVGAIPDEWVVRKFKDATDLITCGLAATPTYVNEYQGYPFLSSTNVKDGQIIWSGFKFIGVDLHKRLYKNNPPRRGDILYSRVGTIGEAAVVDVDFEFSIYVSLTLIKTGSLLDNQFLKHLLNSPTYKSLANRTVLLGGGVGNLNVNVVREFLIPVPPFPEQRAIAAALNDAEALITALDRLIAKKRDIKQAAMQELLMGKRRLPGFSGEWESASIEQLEARSLVKLSRGKVISNNDIEKNPGDYPIYSSSVKNSGLFGRYGDYMFDEEMITWSVDGGGDFFYRPKHRFSVTNVSGYMRVNTSVLDYRFLAAELQVLHGRLAFDYQTKAHPSVIRKAYVLSFPTLAEQKAIADVIYDMDAEIAALERKRDKTRLLKQGMMQELLTGRIRLVGA